MIIKNKSIGIYSISIEQLYDGWMNNLIIKRHNKTLTIIAYGSYPEALHHYKNITNITKIKQYLK